MQDMEITAQPGLSGDGVSKEWNLSLPKCVYLSSTQVKRVFVRFLKFLLKSPSFLFIPVDMEKRKCK